MTEDVPTMVTGVSVTPLTLGLSIGQQGTLTTIIVPSNADDQSVVWSTSDPLVATVDGSGTVTAVSTGNATVTVTTTDGGFTAQSTISVTDAPLVCTGAVQY